MVPFQFLYLLVMIAALISAWLGGAHLERRAVVVILLAFIASVLTQDIGTDRIRYGIILVDLALAVFLVHQAMVHDRWWLLVASAAQAVTMLAHAGMFLDPDLTLRVSVATQWAFGFVVTVALGLSPLERKLAGEPSVFASWLQSRRNATA